MQYSGATSIDLGVSLPTVGTDEDLHPVRDPGFAPRDLTDRRRPYEWASRFPKPAQVAIYLEAAFLLVHLLAVPILLLIIVLDLPSQRWPAIEGHFAIVGTYATAWLGGTFGGTLFAMKWHYHVVAKGLWHADRRLWRLFTPYLSGGLAFVAIALIRSNILIIFDAGSTDDLEVAFGISFLVGYFSDTAVAKLAEIAEILFGPSILSSSTKMREGSTNAHDSLHTLAPDDRRGPHT